MARKRKLANLIEEEVQRPQDLEVTESDSNKVSEDELANSESKEVSNLQGNEVTNSEGNEVSNLQSNEVTKPLSKEKTDEQNKAMKNRQTSTVKKLPNSNVSESKGKGVTDSQTYPEDNDRISKFQSSELPKYLTLVRKETRLRDDQLEQLTMITRKLNRQRWGKGERITENTLIRIAVDLLLSHADNLQGTTEKELADNFGLSNEKQKCSTSRKCGNGKINKESQSGFSES